jgi:hypothetical protein
MHCAKAVVDDVAKLHCRLMAAQQTPPPKQWMPTFTTFTSEMSELWKFNTSLATFSNFLHWWQKTTEFRASLFFRNRGLSQPLRPGKRRRGNHPRGKKKEMLSRFK